MSDKHRYWGYGYWSMADFVERSEELEDENRQLRGYGNTVERRQYRNGTLVLEYRRGKSGRLTGPYWSFRWREEDRQRSIYIGKTDDPEGALDRKLREKGQA